MTPRLCQARSVLENKPTQQKIPRPLKLTSMRLEKLKNKQTDDPAAMVFWSIASPKWQSKSEPRTN